MKISEHIWMIASLLWIVVMIINLIPEMNISGAYNAAAASFLCYLLWRIDKK